MFYPTSQQNLALLRSHHCDDAIAVAHYDLGKDIVSLFPHQSPWVESQSLVSSGKLLADLKIYDAVLDINSLGQEAIDLFEQNPELPGIIIRDRGHLLGVLSRQRFAILTANPDRKTQYSYRSLHLFHEETPDNFLVLPLNTPIAKAIEIALQRPAEQAFEPILVQIQNNIYKILNMQDLMVADTHIQGQTQQDLQTAQGEIESKTQQFKKTVQELKQAQQQLIQSEKMSALGKMVAGIAHEINNPIGFVYGNIQHADTYTQDLIYLLGLYQKHYPKPAPEIVDALEEVELDFLVEDLIKVLNSMKMGADRVREIVHSMRTFSRLDEAHKKAVDIHEGIDSTLLILQSRLKATPQRLPINVLKNYGKLCPIECYAGQLNQVFMNALVNAIDALEEACQQNPNSDYQPQITITTTTDDTHIVISIADNGVGMSEEVKNRLFDPFFTTKAIGKGTGLGLSISYSIIVEKHHGQLECTSTPGQGTTFTIRIPCRLES
ncbi:MAG: ATP-binding protein [Spirulinaceae cyanobacterium]